MSNDAELEGLGCWFWSWSWFWFWGLWGVGWFRAGIISDDSESGASMLGAMSRCLLSFPRVSRPAPVTRLLRDVFDRDAAAAAGTGAGGVGDPVD